MLAMYLVMLETEADQRRFTRLYEAYEKTAYAVALRVLGDPSRAEDAAQQTWFQLLRRWDRVSALPWDETEGYVVTAAKNCALTFCGRSGGPWPFPRTGTPRPGWSGRTSTAISSP
ncbi:sigma factor [uncultured Oscillibacter sp.]|uniref:RNA polymerase sigma factor n=1 Tax=uncultured Oscillibacter sp. TaxID=876091 RepID=UPI00261A8502|nr:sigma factor [uncultured Oscillibacter sp.]